MKKNLSHGAVAAKHHTRAGNGTIPRAFLACCIGCLCLWKVAWAENLPSSAVRTPRIVNLYNFIRNSDYRLNDSENILFETTRKQIELLKPTGLPATWALQYDALINPRYQKLLKEQLSTNDEIAAWWEIPRPLTQKAGIKWRGHDHEWDSTANVGFSPGYTPDERRKLVDVYMADFKAIFGQYPRTVGSWFIDEVTLEYMSKRYGIIASCNCKDQIGTDGYTLWGSYWNQAYYPSAQCDHTFRSEPLSPDQSLLNIFFCSQQLRLQMRKDRTLLRHHCSFLAQLLYRTIF